MRMGDMLSKVQSGKKFNIYKWLLTLTLHYNHKKYWKMRSEVINPKSKKFILIRYWYLYRIKRMDAFGNSSMGTNMGSGAQFETPPNLPHHLNGIIISHYAKIGKNCTIHQQVTIAGGDGPVSATIGDNVYIGAGAKIIGDVHIGDNVKIGANAVVVKDIPANATAVGVPARVII
ncbi:MAG: serine acetyltransferase [Clostridia bacterium]|nr:serine acetyltransferase [Clostridia bacterium]